MNEGLFTNLDKQGFLSVVRYFERYAVKYGKEEARLLEEDYWEHLYSRDIRSLIGIILFLTERNEGNLENIPLKKTFSRVVERGVEEEDLENLNILLQDNAEIFGEFFEALCTTLDIKNTRHIKVLSVLSKLAEFFFYLYNHFDLEEVEEFATVLNRTGVTYETQIEYLLDDLNAIDDVLEDHCFEVLVLLCKLAGVDIRTVSSECGCVEEYLQNLQDEV